MLREAPVPKLGDGVTTSRVMACANGRTACHILAIGMFGCGKLGGVNMLLCRGADGNLIMQGDSLRRICVSVKSWIL
jgi:hypothetical protein